MISEDQIQALKKAKTKLLDNTVIYYYLKDCVIIIRIKGARFENDKKACANLDRLIRIYLIFYLTKNYLQNSNY